MLESPEKVTVSASMVTVPATLLLFSAETPSTVTAPVVCSVSPVESMFCSSAPERLRASVTAVSPNPMPSPSLSIRLVAAFPESMSPAIATSPAVISNALLLVRRSSLAVIVKVPVPSLSVSASIVMAAVAIKSRSKVMPPVAYISMLLVVRALIVVSELTRIDAAVSVVAPVPLLFVPADVARPKTSVPEVDRLLISVALIPDELIVNGELFDVVM